VSHAAACEPHRAKEGNLRFCAFVVIEWVTLALSESIDAASSPSEAFRALACRLPVCIRKGLSSAGMTHVGLPIMKTTGVVKSPYQRNCPFPLGSRTFCGDVFRRCTLHFERPPNTSKKIRKGTGKARYYDPIIKDSCMIGVPPGGHLVITREN
jgi:hypothetical protein